MFYLVYGYFYVVVSECSPVLYQNQRIVRFVTKSKN